MQSEVKLSPMRDEKGVKRNIQKLLDMFDWYWWMPPANGYGKAGISDINAIKDGVFLAIEAKFGSNKPTVMQRAFLESIRAKNGFGFVVNEKNIEHLQSFLTDFQGQTELVAEKQQMDNAAGARLVDAMRALMALT
jgi:Holliday junction resolvase